MRRPTEPFHPEWNGIAQRSTVPPFRGAGGTTPQAKVQEAAPIMVFCRSARWNDCPERESESLFQGTVPFHSIS
jgi:hypothetical protein